MSLSEWWDRLLHEPIRDNPWGLGAILLIMLLIFAPFAKVWWEERRRGR